VLDNAIETELMVGRYESLASDLLEWIQQTVVILNNRKFSNSLVGVQQQLQAFNTYRTAEKPPKSEPSACSSALNPSCSSSNSRPLVSGSQRRGTWRFSCSPSRAR